MERCAFCSATSREDLIFYKGLLSTLICSDCVKAIMLLILDNTINQMEFKKPDNL